MSCRYCFEATETMKLFILLSFVVYTSGKLQSLENDTSPEENWFAQFLDHYKPMETRVWGQRYFEIKDYYKSNGPIFLLLGSQYVDGNYLKNNFVTKLAKKFNAMSFLLEQRFYGSSHPTPDMSLRSLDYMNEDQSLADIAYFMQEMQIVHNIPEDAKWILFGCSLSGTLAGWSRFKFPHLVYGAVVDGAPFVAQADFSDYYSTAEQVFKNFSQACSDEMNLALKEVYKSISSSSGLKKLNEIFNPCQPIITEKSSPNDVTSIFYDFLSIITEMTTIKNDKLFEQSCNILLNDKKGPLLNRLAGIIDLYLETGSGTICLPILNFKQRIANLRDKKSWDYSVKRLPLYQQCTEFGWFFTSKSKPFNLPQDSVPLEYFERLCSEVFETRFPERIEQGIERTNLAYGGNEIANTTSRTAFVYGTLDPWKSLGITYSKNPEISTYLIPDAGPCPLNNPLFEDNSPRVLETKKKIQQLIEKWLREE